MNLRIFKIAIRAAELFIDLLEVIMEWYSSLDAPDDTAPEGGESA